MKHIELTIENSKYTLGTCRASSRRASVLSYNDSFVTPRRFGLIGSLQESQKLTISYGNQTEAINVPIKDPDPFYADQKTFLVLNKRRQIYRFSSSKSLFIFEKLSKIRLTAIKIYIHPYFNNFIFLTILINLMVMMRIAQSSDTNFKNTQLLDQSAIFDQDPESHTKFWHMVKFHWDKFDPYLEYLFTVIYSFETLVKIIARGFVLHTFAYLRSGWDLLDFTILIIAYMLLGLDFFEDSNMKADSNSSSVMILKTLRVLRVLKAVSALPTLRTIVSALTTAVKKLKDSLILSLCGLSCFALIGHEVFARKLRRKCFIEKQLPFNYQKLWSKNEALGDQWTFHKETLSNVSEYLMIDYNDWNGNFKPLLCDKPNTQSTCRDGGICLEYGSNPNFNYTNFDNFADSLLCIFRVSLQDNWEVLYLQILQTCGSWSWIFFKLLIFLGSYYLINLILAVVASAYQQQRKYIEALLEEEKRELLRQKKFFNHRRVGVGLSENHNSDLSAELQLLRNRMSNPFYDKWINFRNKYLAWETNFCLNYTPIRTFRKRLEKIVSHSYFDLLVLFLVILNVSILILEPSIEDYTNLRRSDMNLEDARSQHLQAENSPDKIFSKEFFKQANSWFTVLFSIECVMKIIALSPVAYFNDSWNRFDFLVVISSLAELFLTSISEFNDIHIPGHESTDKSNPLLMVLTSLKAARIVRILKIARTWTTLNRLMILIGNSLGSVGYLILILVILLIVFGLLGVCLLRNYHQDPDTKLPFRWHMNDFTHAFMVVFRICCGEWIENMWNCRRSTQSHIMCMTLFISTVCFAQLIILNLFLALLLNSFSGDAIRGNKNKQNNLKYNKMRTFGIKLAWNSRKMFIKLKQQPERLKKVNLKKPLQEFRDSILDRFRNSDATVYNQIRQEAKKHSPKVLQIKSPILPINADNLQNRISGNTNYDNNTHQTNVNDHLVDPGTDNESYYENTSDDLHTDTGYGCSPEEEASSSTESNNVFHNGVDSITEDENFSEYESFPIERIQGYDDRPILEILSENLKEIQPKILKLIESRYFEYLIIFFITLSSLALALEDKEFQLRKYSDQKYYIVMRYLDILFTFIFTVEMLLKWIGLGFKRYFSNKWCLLDFFIVVIAVVSISIERAENEYRSQQAFEHAKHQLLANSVTDGHVAVVESQRLKMLRVLRAFRALRPLRAMSRVSGIKIVTDALLCSIPSILNVLLILMLFWLVFAIVGINMFKNKFYRCIWLEKDDIKFGQRQLYHTDQIFKNYPTDISKLPDIDLELDELFGTHIYKMYQNESYINSIQDMAQFTVRDKTECLKLNGTRWENLWFNFDQVSDAYVSLIQIATFKGWLTIMQAAVDATEVDQQPKFESNFSAYIFFVVFILFGAFFTLNLFISVVIDNFNEQKRKFEVTAGEIFLTDLQKQLHRSLKRLKSAAPEKLLICPENPIRRILFKIVMQRNFELATLLITISNLAFLAFETDIKASKILQVGISEIQ